MKKALLVIDMLNDFIKPDGKLYCGSQGQAIIPFVRERIEAYRASDDLIVFICDRHEADDLEFKRFPPHCIEGTDGARVIDELQYEGYEGNITGKQRYSSFFDTDLEEQLEDICEVEVVGVCTNICVFFTVEELCNRDKRVTVYRRGVASFDPFAHEYALSQMKDVLGAEIK